jgi:Ser/Thr protein kinase RdoA (MazF antagonist)
MQGALGDKIGEGATSDVYAWAPGQVVKLFKAGAAQGLGWHEARMTRAVFAAGGPALEVLDRVQWEGRFGIVLPRLDGPSLLRVWETGGVTSEEAGAILAQLYLSVHRTPPPDKVFCLRDWFGALSRGVVSPPIFTGVLARIERLAPPPVLCHGDLHPDNVIMTVEGPKIIDWSAAVRAPAAFDVWRCDIKLKELAYAADGVDRGEVAVLNAALRSEYARLAEMSPATLAIEPYLTILRAAALAEGALGAHVPREQLIQLLEADLAAGSG